MDFVILKVNGIDVSQVSHEEAVQVFQSAPEPIQVEVIRRREGDTAPVPKPAVSSPCRSSAETQTRSSSCSPLSDSPPSSFPLTGAPPSSTIGSAHAALCPTSPRMQPKRKTSGAAPDTCSRKLASFLRDLPPEVLEGLYSDEDDDEQEDVFELLEDDDAEECEEVILRRGPGDRFAPVGLGVSATPLPSPHHGPRHPDPRSDKEPGSVLASTSADRQTSGFFVTRLDSGGIAGREGGLKLGDQILQVNGHDVTSLHQLDALLDSNWESLHFLVVRHAEDFTYRRAGSWLGDSGVECLTESNGGSHQNSNRSLPSDVPSSKATEELFDSGTGTSCSSESARSEANNNNNNSSSHKKASKDKDNKMASGDQGGEGRQQENNNSSSPLSIDKELYLLNQKIESIQLECDAMMRREEKTSTTGTPSKTTSPAPTKKTPPVRPSHLRLSPLLGGSSKEFDEPLYALPIDTFGSSVPLERKSLSPPTPPRNYVQGRPPHFGGALGSKTRRNFSEPRLTDIAPTPSPLGPAPCFRLPWESQLINLQEKKSAASKLAEWTRKLREKTTGTKDQPSPLRRIASLGRRSSFRERSASASKANSVSVESDLGKQPPEVRNSLNGSLERKTHSIQHPLLRSSPPPSASHYPLARPPPPAYSSPRLTLKVDKQASSHLVLSEQNKQDPNPVLVALPPKCSSCGRGQPTRPPRSGKKDAGGSDEQSKASLHRDSSDIYASKINPTVLPQYSLRGSADRLDTAEYRYVSSPFPGEYNPKDPSWRVRVRPDGSRYITKRPSKARRIRDQREDQINEERSGQTTDDETVSDYKFGRYWPKDDRKRHLEQARERRKRQQAIISAKNGSPVSGGGSVRVTDIHRRHSSAGSPSAAMGSSLFDAHGDFDHRRSADPIRFERASPEMTKA